MNQSKNTKIRTNGQIRNVNDSELQSLSADRGLAQPPTSPLAAQLLGASDDSAKMAGTKPQKAFAFNSSPENNLRDVQRRQQNRTTQTAQEAISFEKSETLEQAGTIGNSIQNLVNSYIPNQATGQLTENSSYEVALSPDLLATLDDQTKQQLEELALNPSVEGAAALAPALQAAGLEGAASNPLQYINLKETGQSASELIADPNTITVGNLFSNADFQAQSGLSPTELAELLEIPEVDLAGLTVPELNDKIRQVEQEEFSRIEDLRNISQDPQSSPSERRQARQQLLDLGASGVASSEAGVQQLIEKVDSSDTLTFGNEVITVEDFLSDENISNLTREYLDADEETQAKMAEKYGSDFVNFIQSHQETLETASDQLDNLNTSVDTIQEENEALGDIEGYGKLDTELLSDIIPGYGEFSFDRLEAPPVIEALNNPATSREEKQRIVESLTTLNDLDPELARQVANYSIQELKELGAFDGGSEQWNEHIKWIATDYQLDNMDPEDPDYDRLVVESYFENGTVSYEDVQNQLDIYNQLGGGVQSVNQETGEVSRQIENRPAALELFDKDFDGQIDDIETLRESLQENQGSFTSGDALLGSEHLGDFAPFQSYLSDGELSSQDLSDIYNEESGAGIAAVNQLARLGDPKAREILRTDPGAGEVQAREAFEAIFPTGDIEDFRQSDEAYFNSQNFLDEVLLSEDPSIFRKGIAATYNHRHGFTAYNPDDIAARYDLFLDSAYKLEQLLETSKYNNERVVDEYMAKIEILRSNANKFKEANKSLVDLDNRIRVGR